MSNATITAAFAGFRDGPGDAIHSDELRPVFESLSAEQQEQVTGIVRSTARYDFMGLSKDLGIGLSVAVGLINLLHPDA